MKFNFPFVPQRSVTSATTPPKKKFAPWETVFDEMFLLWFIVDSSPRHPRNDHLAGSEQ